jgi:hypothetical protein
MADSGSVYCRADTPGSLVERFCQALVSGREDIVWDIGGTHQPTLPLERMVKESPITPSTSRCTRAPPSSGDGMVTYHEARQAGPHHF